MVRCIGSTLDYVLYDTLKQHTYKSEVKFWGLNTIYPRAFFFFYFILKLLENSVLSRSQNVFIVLGGNRAYLRNPDCPTELGLNVSSVLVFK